MGAAALAGLVLHRWYPDVFRADQHGGGATHGAAGPPHDASDAPDTGNAGSKIALHDDTQPTLTRNAAIVGGFLVAWLVPVGALAFWRGFDDVLAQEAWFFTKAAFVTFGGAYAVLSYMADQAVNFYHWVSTGEMVQGLGLAESTPGPLIMVTSYVGFLAAYKQPGNFPPVLSGTFGALITVYATFLPCFLFVFLGAPYIERLAGSKRLGAALSGVTAAVVGVIANLAVFFGLHVLPRPGIVDWFAVIIAAVSLVAIRRFAVKVYWLVPVAAVVGMAWSLLGGTMG
jgi:chromate transporter